MKIHQLTESEEGGIQIREMTDEDFDEMYLGAVRCALFKRPHQSMEDLNDAFGLQDKSKLHQALVTLRGSGELDTSFRAEQPSVTRYSLTTRGMESVFTQGAAYRLNKVNHEIAKALNAADLPITALIAAAYRKADTINAALIERCWPNVVAQLHERYRTPFALVAGESFDGSAKEFNDRCDQEALRALKPVADIVERHLDKGA